MPKSAPVAVITGAGGDIGRALALQLAAAGARLVLLDVNGAAAGETARRVSRADAEPLVRVVDSTDGDALAHAVQDVRDRFGRVDRVFCLAGVIHTGDVVSTDQADFEHVLRVNAVGAFNTAKTFLPHLIESSGQLVFVSSVLGLMAVPNYSAYCASKFAVRALAEGLQQEMTLAGHDVRVSCAYPGGVKTGIMRRGRFAADVDEANVISTFENRVARITPDEAAAAILRGAERGKRRILVGRDAKAADVVLRLAGPAHPRLVTAVVRVARVARGASTLSRSRRTGR